jgi:DNA-binding MarR family transcriptional regulator
MPHPWLHSRDAALTRCWRDEERGLSQREDVSQLYFRLFTEIVIIAQLSGNRLERVLPEGMSLAQFHVLTHFVRLGGQWAPGRLARAFQVTKGAMTNTVQRLEAQGFVKIDADPKDARAKLVEITDTGRRAHELAIRAVASAIGELAGEVRPGEVRNTLPFLENLRKILDQRR